MRCLGIDGGGSKTTFLLVDEQDQELYRAQSGPTNWLSVGKDTAANSLRQGLQNLPLKPDIVCGGFAGAARPESRAFYTQILQEMLPDSRVVVESDAFVSYIGAIGIQSGVLLIAGTGSIAIGRKPDGTMIRVGGWGSEFGDEGSGFWIGREAIRVALRMLDSETSSDFANRIARALDLTTVSQVPGLWASNQLGVPGIADIFREVVRIYPAQPANRILSDAATHLRAITEIAMERVGVPDCRRSLSGSVATHPTIRSLIGLPFEDPRRSPEWGAVIWAREV